MKHCKNCGNPVRDSYCSHCGQKNEIGRITFHYIWGEIFHFFTHIEHGFLFTSVKMLTSPGLTVTSFIKGERKKYQSPVSYFLIWVTIFILSLYWIKITYGENKVIDYSDYWGPSGATQLAISHLSLVLTVIIPLQALYLYLLVTGKVYNYFETLVVGIYMVGTVILLQFVFAFIALLIYLFTYDSVSLRFSDILKFGYFIWFIIDFIKYFTVKAKWIRAIAFALLAAVTFTIWRMYGVPELINLFLEKN